MSAALCCTLLLVACSLSTPSNLGGYRQFLVEEGLPTLDAEGVVSFTYKGDTQSGELFLRTAADGSTLLQLKARVTGSLGLEIRFDARQLLVLDYVNKSYYQGDNLPETRQDLFNVDLTPDEFRTVLTGRVSRQRFERGRGTLLGLHEATFRRGEDRYIFTLGDDGLPLSWVKQHAGLIQLRVEYRSYQDVPTQSGAPIRLPERVRVFVGEPQPRLVLGIKSFTVPTAPPPLTFALPAEAASFHPQ